MFIQTLRGLRPHGRAGAAALAAVSVIAAGAVVISTPGTALATPFAVHRGQRGTGSVAASPLTLDRRPVGPVVTRLADTPEAYGRWWHLAGAGATTQRAIVEEIERQVGHPLRVRVAGKTTLRLLGLFNPLLREMVELEQQGAGAFFGEPEFDLGDLMRVAPTGQGIMSILELKDVQDKPALSSTFMMWMLARLYHTLPEAGDLEKPKLVFFFDEAHLLFDDAPKPLMDRIEQIARLVRSKGVGVYFITQNPMDVPNSVSAQLGNRVQHALRAFTPQEQRAVRAAAETFRKNPDLDTERVILELKVGEALVSTLENKGEPSIVQRTLIRPPEGRVGRVSADERLSVVEYSPVYGKYEEAIDRESAHDVLTKRADKTAEEAGAGGGGWGDIIFGGGGSSGGKGKGRPSQGMGEMIGKDLQRSISRTIATTIKNIIVKSITGRSR